MLQHHDREWGGPVHDDRKHFEFLVLDGALAGLSGRLSGRRGKVIGALSMGLIPRKWRSIRFDEVEKLKLNADIIRNGMKIEAAVRKARAFLKIQEEFGSLDSYCWRFVDGQPMLNCGGSCDRFLRLLSNPMPSARTLSVSDSVSLVRPAPMTTCRLLGW